MTMIAVTVAEWDRVKLDADRYRWIRQDQHKVGSWPSFLPPDKFDQWVDEGRAVLERPSVQTTVSTTGDERR